MFCNRKLEYVLCTFPDMVNTIIQLSLNPAFPYMGFWLLYYALCANVSLYSHSDNQAFIFMFNPTKLIVMSRNLNVKFYPKKAFIRKNGRIPVLVKFSCEGMSEFLSHVDVDITTWISAAQKVKGNSKDAKEINSELEKISDSLKNIKRVLEDKGEIRLPK